MNAGATCELVEDRLSEFLGGELGGAEREEIQEHLEVCPACSQLKATHEEMGAMLLVRGEFVPSSSGTVRALETELGRRRRALWLRRVVSLPSLASGVMFLTAVILTFRNSWLAGVLEEFSLWSERFFTSPGLSGFLEGSFVAAEWIYVLILVGLSAALAAMGGLFAARHLNS